MNLHLVHDISPNNIFQHRDNRQAKGDKSVPGAEQNVLEWNHRQQLAVPQEVYAQ